MSYKKSIEAAMHKYHAKQLPETSPGKPKRKNKKPEKLVEKDVLLWAKQNNISLHIVEASSYDPRLGRKGLSRATAGFPDAVGNTTDGRILWIELKAKDRRSTLSESQRSFLESRIRENCFAVVIDSVERLSQCWTKYNSLGPDYQKREYLMAELPQKRKPRNQKTKDDLPF